MTTDVISDPKSEPVDCVPPPVTRLPQQILHDYRPQVIFEVEPTESPDMTTVTTECDGRTFQGFGPTAEDATQLAAIEILKYLHEMKQVRIEADDLAALESWTPGMNTSSQRFPAVPIDAPNMSPLMYLNQMVKNLASWEFTQISLMPSKFKATIVVNETTYEVGFAHDANTRTCTVDLT